MMSAPHDITNCSIHQGNSREYFCRSHDKIGCKKCMETNHTKCHDVSHIDKFTKNLEDGSEYKQYQDVLNDIRFVSKEINDNIGEHEAVLEKGLRKEKMEVERIRSDMNTIFDIIMANMEDKEQEALHKDMLTTAELSHKAENAILDLEKIENQVENMRRSKKMKELFIKLKSIKPDLNSIEKRMDKLCRESNLGHNRGRLALQSIQGETEVQVIKLEEACVEFKLSVSKTNPY